MEKLSEKRWDDIELDSFADVKSGRDIYAQDRVQGDTPYVTAGTANNGIGFFVGNDNDSRAQNTISVARNGAVGEAFYHPYLALFGNDCRRVNLRETSDGAVQMFVTQCIRKQKAAFSYSRKLGTARLKRLHVMLPVDDANEPDYAFMASYANETGGGLLMRYKSFLNGRIGDLRHVDVPALEEKEWGEFLIGELFEVSRPKARKKDSYPEGKVPFVASGSVNNGVIRFCDNPSNDKPDKGNCITVSPVDGSTFYQPADFFGARRSWLVHIDSAVDEFERT